MPFFSRLENSQKDSHNGGATLPPVVLDISAVGIGIIIVARCQQTETDALQGLSLLQQQRN